MDEAVATELAPAVADVDAAGAEVVPDEVVAVEVQAARATSTTAAKAGTRNAEVG